MKTFTFVTSAIAFLYCMVFPSSLLGQTTGSFETNITFAGNPRQLAAFVPTDYNAANKYKLIVCLHGLGDNAVNYRNALVNTLGWRTQLPNTIFICPESSTITDDYFSPINSGNEEIIRASIDYIKTNYSIDTTNIILQGFSLGGRAALRYGLNNPAVFKGLLLNTPAIQGVKEGTNRQPSYPYNFANANKIPVYISHGENDIFYTAPIDSILEKLVIGNGPVRLKRVTGLGHTIPVQAQLGDFTKFFDSTTTANLGIEIVRIYLAERTCDGKINGSVLVRNTGKTTIQSVSLDFSTTGSTPTRVLSSGLNLAPFQHAILPIDNQFAGSNETQTFTVKASLINNLIDTDPFSPNNENRLSKGLVSQSSGRTLPFTEGFDNVDFPPTGWTMNASGDVYSAWDRYDDVKKTGAGSMGAINTILFFDNSFRVEEVQTPVLNLTSLPNPHLTFDLAFNYSKFKNGNDSVEFADTLEVLVSTDCGKTFTRVFRNGGKGLATFANPMLNPNTIEKCFIVPADSNWKKMFIPLSNFGTSANAIISFRYQSALGGSIHIDNVSVGNNALTVKETQASAISLYPNPANDVVTIEAAEKIVSVTIKDISGKLVFKAENGQQNSTVINTSKLSEGIYIFETNTVSGTVVNKVVISR